jgi:hypothetical protein
MVHMSGRVENECARVLSSVIEKCSDFEKNISQKHDWLDENSRFVCNTGHALQYCTVFLFTVGHSRV